MIELLEIDPEITVEEVKKAARRLAMTGGFEVALQEGLSEQQLTVIIDRFGPEVGVYEMGDARRRSSTAFRILRAAAALVSSSDNREKLKRLGVL
ncbi:MAG: hypothetical protein K1X83_04010 [Oligoflexia bacterium]|nr:hypothetical protein [Oligoflexia bacterium]